MTLTKKQLIKIIRAEGRPQLSVPDNGLAIYYFDLPKKEISLIRSQLNDIEGTLEFHRTKFTPMEAGGFGGAWDTLPTWIITAGVIILIGKTLFEGFLKEFGAKGARALTNAIKSLFNKEKELRSERFIKLFPDGIPKTLAETHDILAIVVKTKNSTFKFDFPYRLDGDALEEALKTLPKVIPLTQAVSNTRKDTKLLSFSYQKNGWKQDRQTVRTKLPAKKRAGKKRQPAAAAKSPKAPKN